MQWLAKCRSVWSDSLLALGATMRSQIDVALLVADDEGVEKLLGEAMVGWQERRGLTELIIESRDDSIIEFREL